MKRKPLLVLLAALVLALTGGGAWYWLSRPEPPPSLQSEPVVLVKFAGTPRFKELPEAQRREYAQAMLRRIPELIQLVQDGKLTEKEQQDAMRNVLSTVAIKRISEYFVLGDARQRTAYLDGVIDEQNQIIKQLMAAKAAAAARNDPSKPQPKVVDLSPERLKEMFEGHSPEERARFAQFAEDLNKRRLERGLEQMTNVFTRIAGGKK